LAAVVTESMRDLDGVGALLDEHRAGGLFVSGCVANQSALYDRFGAVVLLSAPVDVILARVVDRTNPFGSGPKERAKIANDLAEFEPILRASADHEIDTTVRVMQVVMELERIATQSDDRPASGSR
jgi:shikimate kinase